ncbi:hypothetical protein AAF712_014968 [Marasmius tenuissimus]|uniref:Uncharacterized protein n=1 Tax=Marasmius tenuissimus TaxID=585030 RepID=A0ABR2ZBP0_9AGAR
MEEDVKDYSKDNDRLEMVDDITDYEDDTTADNDGDNQAVDSNHGMAEPHNYGEGGSGVGSDHSAGLAHSGGDQDTGSADSQVVKPCVETTWARDAAEPYLPALVLCPLVSETSPGSELALNMATMFEDAFKMIQKHLDFTRNFAAYHVFDGDLWAAVQDEKVINMGFGSGQKSFPGGSSSTSVSSAGSSSSSGSLLGSSNRPNSDPFPIVTSFKHEAWSELLGSLGLLLEFVDIPKGIQEGFLIGLENYHLNCTFIPPNHFHTDFEAEYMSVEVQQDRDHVRWPSNPSGI